MSWQAWWIDLNQFWLLQQLLLWTYSPRALHIDEKQSWGAVLWKGQGYWQGYWNPHLIQWQVNGQLTLAQPQIVSMLICSSSFVQIRQLCWADLWCFITPLWPPSNRIPSWGQAQGGKAQVTRLQSYKSTRYPLLPCASGTCHLKPFLTAQQQNPVMGPEGLGHRRWGQHITHQLSCRLQLFGGNLCTWHVTVLQTCTNCDKLFEILWCPRPVLQRTKLWDPLIFFLFSRHCFRDLPIVRQQFKQSFVSPCRAFVQSDHKALFINTVFNIDQICQRYSCSGGTFLGTKMIICLQ